VGITDGLLEIVGCIVGFNRKTVFVTIEVHEHDVAPMAVDRLLEGPAVECRMLV